MKSKINKSENMNKHFVIILSLIISLTLFGQSRKTEILVLGTSHLSQMKNFEPSMLESVIEKLDTYKFDVVCIEKMSGQLLYDIKTRNDDTYNNVINGRWGKVYLSIADTVQKVKKVGFLDVKDSIFNLLKKEKLTDSDRKMLFYNYLATTDIPSAALQYQYLKDRNDLFSSDFDRYLINQINKEIDTNSEFYTLALPLAFHQKQNKIESINDFQDEALLFKYFPNFAQECNSKSEMLSKISQLPIYKKLKSLTHEAVELKDLSELYSFLNSDLYKKQDYEGQWKIWFKTNFASGSDKGRYYLWEMRNLQITSNILDVTARNSGKKILVIIGSSHKSFIEKYLVQIEDIKILKYE